MIESVAPGARVEIRDAEWLVRKVDSTSTGGQCVHCVGTSELVKDREAIFLTDIEPTIEILDPAKTKLVPDESAQFRNTHLYIESLLRQTPPTDPPSEEKLYIGHKAAMDLVPYQLDPALQALQQPRQRILIADGVGLGKTLEAGVLLSELIRRGRAKRILVVALKSMLTQFQKEFWARFSIPLVRLDSVGIQRVKQQIPSTHNPFHSFDKSIISIDTLKQDAEYRPYIESCYWDVIIIDEAHNVAERGSNSMRARLAKLLSSRSDALIMLSATPHDGSARSFASLMTMLNPTAIADPESYGPEDIKGLFIRRFKKDIQHQVSSAFQDRRILRVRCTASEAEEKVYNFFAEMTFSRLDQRRGGGQLFKTTLEKALFSSPAACLDTARNRICRLEGEGTSEARRDISNLSRLAEMLESITPSDFAKYRELCEALTNREGGLDWPTNDSADRLVIFTERIETLRFLQENLPRDLKLKKDQVAVLYGTLSDVEQQRVVEQFGKEDSPVRLLIASDIAAEGINLHYLSHRLIHFDIPWSLMVFKQRNGRVDRYGQTRKPEIVYLLTESQNSKINGDSRILDVLIAKDEQAYKNIGDPSAFMNVYDIGREEHITASAIESSTSAQAFDDDLDATIQDDPLAILMGEDEAPTGTAAEECITNMPSIYESDFAYVEEALDFARSRRNLRASVDENEKFITIEVPEAMRVRLKALPQEVHSAIADDGHLVLTTDRERVKREIAHCRKEERAWPRFHLLWDLHPVMDWLNDTVQTAFGRHEAPVIPLPGGRLADGEALFLMTGLIPNRKSHPLIHRWFGVQFRDGADPDILYLDDVLSRTGLARAGIPNRGIEPNVDLLRTKLPAAVEFATQWMSANRDEFEGIMRPKLQEQLGELERLRTQQIRQLEFDFGELSDAARIQQSRKEAERRRIEGLFQEYQEWIRETMTTEDKPFIRVVAVFCNA